ncbi:MAG: nitric oxide reductase activation protein NorD [Deltaproteobacteria bacterium]
MAEPEDLIAEGALLATHAARQLWARRAGADPGPGLPELRRRLELFVVALFPDSPPIGPADPPPAPTLLSRLAGRAPDSGAEALASTDGRRIRLPRRLEAVPPPAVAARYRLLALVQAARAARGTPALIPSGDAFVGDLFLLSEAAATDRMLAGMLPGLVGELRAARADALWRRRDDPRASPRERLVEDLTRALLAADPAEPLAVLPGADTPAESLAWARERGARLAGLPLRYRGVPPVALWGTVAPPPDAVPGKRAGTDGEHTRGPGRTKILPRRPRVRPEQDGEDDPSPGTWIVRADDPQEKAEDPAGLQRPADRDPDTDAGELADALSELPEARLVRAPGPVFEVLASDEPLPRGAPGESGRRGTGVVYPEWDCRVAAYRAHGAVVRERAAPPGDAAWADRALRRHDALLRGIRRDLERLRPRRAVLRQQPDGAELDVDAYVSVFADAHGGGAADDRLYVDARPRRRDLAIALLVDASASTDAWVAGERRVIDVEKEALLIVSEALATLGDRHAILAFNGEGPGRVDIRQLKGFGEPGGTETVRRRIAALEPDGFTRAGAALRHAAVALAAEDTRHRLLLVLSDGRPNDVDAYEGRYGIEDTAMAVREARLQGMHCFCLTVDREAPSYAARIFGPAHFAVLPRPEQLPRVLMESLCGMIRTS